MHPVPINSICLFCANFAAYVDGSPYKFTEEVIDLSVILSNTLFLEITDLFADCIFIRDMGCDKTIEYGCMCCNLNVFQTPFLLLCTPNLADHRSDGDSVLNKERVLSEINHLLDSKVVTSLQQNGWNIDNGVRLLLESALDKNKAITFDAGKVDMNSKALFSMLEGQVSNS